MQQGSKKNARCLLWFYAIAGTCRSEIGGTNHGHRKIGKNESRSIS